MTDNPDNPAEKLVDSKLDITPGSNQSLYSGPGGAKPKEVEFHPNKISRCTMNVEDKERPV